MYRFEHHEQSIDSAIFHDACFVHIPVFFRSIKFCYSDILKFVYISI